MDLLTANDRQGRPPPSYYADTARHLAAFLQHRVILTCDVCVIGAGFTGMSATLSSGPAVVGVIVLK
jgi:gamma-glutamylputrescine oxidase